MEAASLPTAAAPRTARPGRLLRLRSDDQLVALFRLGDDAAFDVIHDRYRARLLAYMRQMLGGSRADAEDALQDVLLRAYRTLRADDRPVSLRAWLYRVAHNRCVDHLRRPANQPRGELSEALHAPGDDLLAQAERRDDLRRLVADVGRLPAPQRSALLMREMEGLSYAELADAMQVTVPAVKSLLVRARMGLVEAREARATACVEIRAELAGAHDRGVRASGRSRRHLRECPGCRDYRTALKGVAHGLASLTPAAGPWGPLAKLLGLGGAGTAGTGAAGTVVLGGGAAKVAAIVCCAAVVGGGAVEAGRTLREAPARPATAAKAPAARPAASIAVVTATPTAFAAPVANERTSSRASAADRRPAAEDDDATAEVLPLPEPRTAPLPEAPSLGGSSADEDVVRSAAAGGALAPEEADEVVPPPGAPVVEAPPSAVTQDAEPVQAPAPVEEPGRR